MGACVRVSADKAMTTSESCKNDLEEDGKENAGLMQRLFRGFMRYRVV